MAGLRSGIAMRLIHIHSNIMFRVCFCQQRRKLLSTILPPTLSRIQFPYYLGVCNFSKEITPRQPETDLLLSKLSSSVDTADLLQIVDTHHSIMNQKHLLQALRSLFEHQRSGYTRMPKQEIVCCPEFIQLCKTLKSQARAIDLKETIETLKIISYIGVPSTSVITQVLLQLVRHNVNDLSLQHIVFLDFLLARMDTNPLVEALKIALPLVFETQFSVKLDTSNIALMSEMLQYAARRRISNSCVTLLVDSLTESHQVMDMRTARTVVWALCDLKTDNSEELFRRAMNVLIKTLDRCTFQDVEDLLSKLVKQIAKKQFQFYDESFMDACATYVIRNNCGFESAIWIMRKLSRASHTNIELIDYVNTEIADNPAVLERCKPNAVLSLVTGLANANYKPADWQLIKQTILSHNLIQEGKVELPWLKFAVELAALGCFSTPLLVRIFQEDFLRQFLAREYNFLDHLQLLLLYQSVKTLCPSYSGPLPPVDIIEKAVASNGEHLQTFPLQGALERGLGDSAYVQNGLYTKMGHFLEHVIVMRKGGYPVALSSMAEGQGTRVYIEDLDVPADSQTIIVLGFHSGCYSVNCSRLRGNFSLLLSTLEALGHSVVAVSLQVWSELPDYEKIPYLMQNIKLKCEQREVGNEIKATL